MSEGGTRQKLAVLGGGTGSLAAVFALTSQPGWEERWEGEIIGIIGVAIQDLVTKLMLQALEKRGYERGGPVMGIQVMNLEEMGALVLRHGAKALGAAHEIRGGHPEPGDVERQSPALLVGQGRVTHSSWETTRPSLKWATSFEFAM